MEDQEDDGLYSVPQASMPLNMRHPPPVDEPSNTRSPPPLLLPKRGSHSFHRVSSLLDRQQPVVSPVAAPRSQSQRKSSVDLPVSVDHKQQPSDLLLSPLGASVSSVSLDESKMLVDDVFSCSSPNISKSDNALPDFEKTRPRPVPRSKSNVSSVALDDSCNTPKNKGQEVITPASASPKTRTTPNPSPRPKPRPRTKLPSPSPVTGGQEIDSTVTTMVNASKTSRSVQSSVSTDACFITRKLSQTNSDPFQPSEKDEFVSTLNLPPDADSLELMLNKEVEKKYGPMSNFMDSNTKENEASEGNEYVMADPVPVAGNSNEKFVSTPPRPLSSKKQAHIPISKKDSVESAFKCESVNEPMKFNFGSDLLQESSTDLSNAVSGLPGDLEANKDQPSTPKPFDIKPFKTIAPFSIETDMGPVSKQVQNLVDIDFSDIDPLWEKKNNLKASPLSQGSGPVTSAPTEPNSGWATFTDSSSTGQPQPQNPYCEPEDGLVDPPQSQKASTSRKLPTTPPRAEKREIKPAQSFHYSAPDAPPPPFPRVRDRIPEPTPPPIPPRPNLNEPPAVTTFQPPTTEPPMLPQQSALLLNHQDSVTSSIFNDLPTPQFPSCADPFSDSPFRSVCQEFNTSQLADGTSSMSQQATPPNGGVVQAAADVAVSEEFGPERISRFVIPPPGTPRRQAHDNSSLPSYSEDMCSDSTDSDGLEQPPMVWPVKRGPPSAISVISMQDCPTSPKRTSRHGYLYKQGGYKANKGWKKRWVVFNGSSLSYYDNNKSEISKRIIPVACMTSVSNDVKSSDKNSFRFKVLTTLNERVFLFSAESLEDCLTWANILMAAITEHKKNVADKDKETETEPPSKKGLIKFNNTRWHFVSIRGQTLSYFNSVEDYQLGSPIHEIDMKLASVKVKDRRKFKMQLWVHYGHFDLSFETDQDMQQWRMAMEDAIAEGLADDTVLGKVYDNISNQRCADCNAENPHWASINLGIVLCKNCAGVHRMFDYRISKIRSLRMDTRVWTPSLIELMVVIGNANANWFWEAALVPAEKLQPTDPMETRKDFITRKYKQRKFCDLHPLSTMGPKALGEELVSTAQNDNVLDSMKILFSGADIMFRRHHHEPTAYELAKESGQRLIMELLYQNGGDPQSICESSHDENRIREDVRLQGFLNKTGPVGKTFEKRWCILEHGALTYYLNEKSTTFKGAVDRADMYFIQEVITDRIGYQFDLSTGMKDNRIFSFSSDCKDDAGEWVRTIAKLMAPIAVMEHVGMIDIKFAGYGHMKESLVDEWHETFLVFSWRGLNYMNQDLKFDYIDLRKASSIKMQDQSTGFQMKGPCFVIGATGKSLYLQGNLTRDTERMFYALQDAVTESGSTLNEQALTQDNVPVIVERCLTHVYKMGRDEMGIYRNSAQNSKVQALLTEFRRDAWSVSLTDYTVNEVANALKRFLRELKDSVFERINYDSWINMAGCQDESNRLAWYKYYLDKMPIVNYSTLKRIILHLRMLAQKSDQNKMNVENLATCFAPSLLRTDIDVPNLMSSIPSKEIHIILDLLNHAEYFFQIDDKEQQVNDNIKKAEEKINDLMDIATKRQTLMEPISDGIHTPIHILSREGQSHNILVTSSVTARASMEKLERTRVLSEQGNYALYELLFKGAIERPIFPDERLWETTQRWQDWEDWVKRDNSVCLCARETDLLEKLDQNLGTSMLSSKLSYAVCKKKFKKYHIEFKQCRLVIYTSPKASFNIEDLTIYVGLQPDRSPKPPTRYGLTFLQRGEKHKSSAFGHSLCFDTEDELYRWASALYVAQQPKGLLTWSS